MISLSVLIKKYKKNFWLFNSIFLSLYFFITSMIWVLLDKAPPTWDDAMYLNHILNHVEAIKSLNIKNIIYSLFFTDPGRMPLGPILAVPLSLLLQASELSAMLTLNLFWFILGFALYKIGEISSSKKVGFFSFLLVGLLPIVQITTHLFLIDFFLLTFVCISIYLIILNYKTQNKYFFFLALMMALGLLTKVTFLIFVFFPFLLFSIDNFKYLKKRQYLVFIKGLIIPFISFLIILPYISVNFKQLLQQSKSLNSASLAALYNMHNPFTLKSFINYLYLQFSSIYGVFILILLFFSIFKFLKNKNQFLRKKKLYIYLVLIFWFIPALFIFGFGYIQDPRYIMPALPALIILSIQIIDKFNHISKFIFNLIIIFLINIHLIHINFLKFPFDIPITFTKYTQYYFPDKQNWYTTETITAINKLLSSNNLPNLIFFLGGNKQYHISLFTYFSRLQHKPLYFSTLPYYIYPNMTDDEAIKYILNNDVKAVLYKSGENYPEFSSKHDLAIINFFTKTDNLFQKNDLRINLPDGNRYSLFIKTPCKQIEEIDIAKKTSFDSTFSNFFILNDIHIDKLSNLNLLNMKWEIISQPNEKYTTIIHFLDKNNQIISQKDHFFADSCKSLHDKSAIKETLIVDDNILQNTKYLRIGIYQAPDVFTMLKVKSNLQTDWDQRTILIPISIIYDQSQDF